MDTLVLLGSAAGLGVLAGIRLYFVVFALGIAMRMGWFQANPGVSHLDLLAQTPVLLTSGALLIAEFIADKIPWFDTVWDAAHTFIRPIGAAALGITALGTFDPATTLMIGLVTGGAAFAGHASKAAARVAVNHSPEPFSNWIISFAEDLIAPVGLWIVMEHPIVAALLASLLLLAFVLVARAIFKLFRSMFVRLRSAAT
jgi:hypothetical protein